jgi:hypothetical protein
VRTIYCRARGGFWHFSGMAQVGACAEDIKKACANIEPGNLRIASCLKERLTDLSDLCKARLAEVAAAGKTCRARPATGPASLMTAVVQVFGRQ